MRYRAVLFDLFGTLVPCYPVREIGAVIAGMAEDLALPSEGFAAAWHRSFPRRLGGEFASIADCIRETLRESGATVGERAIAAAEHRRLAFERRSLAQRDDVVDTLERLRSGGVAIGILSNCSIETVQAWPTSALSRLEVHGTFSCQIRCAKPEAEAYLHACRALGVAPSSCLFVGDGGSDELAGAQRTGMDAALFRGPEDDDTFPDRIERARWPGPRLSAIAQVLELVR